MTIKGHFLLKTQNLHGVTVIYAIYLLIGAFKADYILNIRSYIYIRSHIAQIVHVMLCYVMYVRVYGFFLKQTERYLCGDGPELYRKCIPKTLLFVMSDHASCDLRFTNICSQCQHPAAN